MLVPKYLTLTDDHRYLDPEGNEYNAISKVIGSIKAPFFAKHISKAVANKENRTVEEVEQEWKEKQQTASLHGKQIHSAVEAYLDPTTGATLPADLAHLDDLIKGLAKEYGVYHARHQEIILYDNTYRIAGMADLVGETTRSNRSVLDLDDFKTNLSRGIQFRSPHKKYLQYPLDHLQDCNFNTYALQLSCYAKMLQDLTGRKIGCLNIVYIPPDNPAAYQRIPVPYMKYEVEALFREYIAKSWL